jgi:RNA polymerase sigma factor (sigma-70 family)
VDYKQQVLDNLSLVDKVVRITARKYQLSADEAEELAASVKLKLFENDCEVLRKFKEHSTLSTYLITVVKRVFLDDRNKRRGKWRPSMQARRLGPIAVLLDQFLTRDRLTFDDAVQAMIVRYGDQVSYSSLYEMAIQLPSRSSRVFLAETELDHVPASTPPEADPIEYRERREQATRVGASLRAVIEELDDEDRAIIYLLYCGNVPIARIAEMFGVNAKPFYRRIDNLKESLRTALEMKGVSQEDIVSIMEHPVFGIEGILETASAGKLVPGPSLEEKRMFRQDPAARRGQDG